MSFTPRQAAIVAELLIREDAVLTAELAEILHIGMRTLQRDLPDIEKEVKKSGVQLERSRSKGIRLSGDKAALHMLRESILQESAPDPSDKTARRRKLLLLLLKEREPRKMYYYSTQLGVSEATVGSDIEALLPWLEKNHLSVIRRQGYGVMLSGTEQDYREAMRRFIHENGGEFLQESGRFNLDAVSAAVLDEADGGIFSLLNPKVMRRVDEVLTAMAEPRLKQLTANAYAGLVTHIAISMERLRQGGRLGVSQEKRIDLSRMEDYDLAKRILAEMEEEFELTVPEEEVSYILLHIKGAKVAYSGNDDGMPEVMENGELLRMIDRMIDAYEPAIALQLKQDEQFIRGLLVHLGPVIVRLEGHMNIFNPLLAEIKEEYADVFARCRKAAKVISEERGLAVSEEEIGFLAMHFGAAEERALAMAGSRRRVHIGIVCASGFGVAQLMMAKLKSKLRHGVRFAAYGKEELSKEVLRENDFFVSTMDLDAYGVDWLRVSPLITAADLSKIEHKMLDYSHTHRREETSDFLEHLAQTAAVAGDMLTLIRSYRRYEIDAALSFRDLLHNLAIRVTGSLAAAERVTEAVLTREELNTQVIPELGIALLHTVTDAVEKPVFITCTPRGTDRFSDAYFKEISAVVLMLSPKDEMRSYHARVLGIISAAELASLVFRECVLQPLS